MSQAVQRTATNWTPSGNADLDRLLSEGVRYRADPGAYQAPDGYRVVPTASGGRVGPEPDWWNRHGDQTVLGAMAALGSAGLWGPALGLGGASGAGGLVGSGEATIASSPATVGATAPSIAGTAGAAAGAGGAGMGMNLGTLSTLGQLGLQGVSALRNHGGQSVPYSHEMESLLQLQQQRMTQANPLYQAILKMAMGMLPTSAQGAMPGGSAMPAPNPRPGMPR